MPNPTRLLRRRPHIDEARVQEARSAALTRLSSIFDGAPSPEALESPEVGATTIEPDAEIAIDRNGHDATDPVAATDVVATDAVDGSRHDGSRDDGFIALHLDLDGPVSLPMTSVPVMASTADSAMDPDGWDLTAPEPAAERPADGDVADVDRPGTAPSPRTRRATRPAGARPAGTGMRSIARPGKPAKPATSRVRSITRPGKAAPPPDPKPIARARPKSRPPVRGAATSRVGAPSRAIAKPTAAPVAVIASCPYCAILLEPPPEADRRCPRCRQKIIVKRVQGRVVYLTEAAVQVFAAERQRIANTGRWTRDRERWLKLAASVDAPAPRIARLERAVLSDVLVADCRKLYVSTVDRLARIAKREHRWDHAARLRRDEALALYRIAGSPVPPPDDVVALHREGALATLRALAEIAKEAELISGGCCDACRADDGRQFRISREQRESRLPHAACAKGLCRCRWELTARDRKVIGMYLRRHTRPDRLAPSA